MKQIYIKKKKVGEAKRNHSISPINQVTGLLIAIIFITNKSKLIAINLLIPIKYNNSQKSSV